MRISIALCLLGGTMLLATCGQTSAGVPVPTATPSATAIAGPTTNDATAGGSPLDANRNCMVCHDLHAAVVVLMPHDPNPACNSCHSGSPARIGCPSCHSMHQVEMEHPSDPDLPCVSCHAPGTVLPE